MKQIIIILCLLTIFISCKNEHRKVREKKDRLSMDTLYTRSWIHINHPDGREEVEIYVTKSHDTIVNQYKLYRNNVIDTLVSEYYDFKFEKTKKPHFYKGTITLHSKYENLKLNKKNQRSLEFDFCEQNADSMSLKFLKSEKSNTINFEFENFYDQKLIGILYQLTTRDTTDDKVNLNQIHILVDNNPKTNNLFLTSFEIEKDKKKKYNPYKLKLTKQK